MIKWTLPVLLCMALVGCAINQWPQSHEIQFDRPACIKPHSGYSYLTCRTIQVQIDSTLIEIPDNFNTNLASIPRWYWSILSPAYSGFIAPSILHDYLYGCPNGRSRYDIDSIFYDALRSQEVSFFTSIKMYFAVRLFGKTYYNAGHYCLKQYAYQKKNYVDKC